MATPPPSTHWADPKQYEHDVIRIARALWPTAEVGGSIVVDGRERDGLFVTEEVVHIVECTTRRDKQKAVEDIEKSIKLGRSLRVTYPTHSVQCWFVTAQEPTPDQQAIAKSKKEFLVKAVSYNTFRSRLIDADAYLNTRHEYAFGSARNLRDGSSKLGLKDYVDLDILCLNDSTIWSVEKIGRAIHGDKFRRTILLGDYGAGKSMTLRELYLNLVTAYNAGKSSAFPAYLNLRDHGGQTDPTEILERHGRKIGFPHPDHLVRAWRAGYVILLLDGFDELSSTGWMAFNRRLQQVRYSTVEALRRFLDETPQDAPVVLAGRVSYFDTEDECLNALGLSRSKVALLSLTDFSEPQIGTFLAKLGVKGELPPWLPTRPLLVGHLAVRGVLEASKTTSGQIDPGEGWEELLLQICEREARTHQVTDSLTLRHIIEELASIARSKGGLPAPLLPNDLVDAYRNVVAREPDQNAETLLMRLPGLTSSPNGEGAREFVDPDFGSAVAAGDVTRFIEDPYGKRNATVARSKDVLQAVGIDVTRTQLERKLVPHEKIYVALKVAIEEGEKPVPNHELAGDLIKLIALHDFQAPKEALRLNIREVVFDELDLAEGGSELASVVFTECMISTLYLPSSATGDSGLPRFNSCLIDHLEGRSSQVALPPEKFSSTTVQTFSEAPATNAAIWDAPDIEPGLKTLITVLRKLFFQKGSGRKESALYRGMPGMGQQTIDKVLDLIRKADFAERSKRGGAEAIWVPHRRFAGRVRSILLSPKESTEAIVSAARKF